MGVKKFKSRSNTDPKIPSYKILDLAKVLRIVNIKLLV